MIGQYIRHAGIWTIAALFLSACVAPPPTPTPQAAPTDSLGTIVVKTAAVAQTQTALFLPPSSTPTLTLTASLTPTVATPTPTFIFLLPTLTPTRTQTAIPPTPVPGGGGPTRTPIPGSSASGSTAKEWTCGIGEKAFPTVEPKEKFWLSVTLRNTGTKTWTNNGVDFLYLSGFRHEGTRIQDLPSTITPGNSVTLRVRFIAPNQPKTYNAFWTLQVGNHPFCRVKLSFEVTVK